MSQSLININLLGIEKIVFRIPIIFNAICIWFEVSTLLGEKFISKSRDVGGSSLLDQSKKSFVHLLKLQEKIMEYHNFVPITADLTGAADAYNQCHYQVSLEFPLKK